MGDNGQLYVDEAVVPAFKRLLPDADLILPNQFEAESVILSLYPLEALHRRSLASPCRPDLGRAGND